MDDRLYRSRDERMIAGVAGGLAERLDLDPSLVRIIWAVLVLPTGFLALLVYVVMAIVVPEESADARLAPTAPTPTGDAAGTGAQASEAATAAVPPHWRGPPPPFPPPLRLRPPLAGRAHRARSRPRPRLGPPRVNRAQELGCAGTRPASCAQRPRARGPAGPG